MFIIKSNQQAVTGFPLNRSYTKAEADAKFAEAIPSFTTGSVPFADTTGQLNQNNSKLFWDNTNFWLGLGTATPLSLLHASGNSSSTNIATFDGTRSISVVNINQTNNTAAGLVMRTADANGTITTGAKVNAVFTSHTASAVSADMAFSTNNAGTVSEKMRILSTGLVGIGTSSPSYSLSVLNNSVSIAPISSFKRGSSTSTISTSGYVNVDVQVTDDLIGVANRALTFWIEPGTGANLTRSYRGVEGDAIIPASDTGVYTSSIIGGLFQALYRGNNPGSISSATGLSATTGGQTGTGNITTVTGISSVVLQSGTGTVTNTYGFSTSLSSNSGTLTNTYGYYCGDITTGTQTNTPFSFYASDANAYNYFAGNVGIGTTTPTNLLEVQTTNAGAVTTLARFRNMGTTTGTEARILLSTMDSVGAVAISSGISSVTVNAATPTADMVFSTTSTGFSEKMRLSAAGYLGIGTAAPSGNIHISGTVNVRYMISDTAATTDTKHWGWQVGSAIGSGILRLRAFNDADTNGINPVVFTRTGIASVVTDFPAGRMGIGAANANTGWLEIYNADASKVGLLLKGAASQSADLLQTQDSSGTVLTSITASGALKFNTSASYPGGVITDGYVYYNSVSGLTLYGAGSTDDIFMVNKSGQSVLSIPTGTIETQIWGNLKFASNLAFPGAVTDRAKVYYSTINGLVTYGAGSTYDLLFANKNGSGVFAIPTGTSNAYFLGNVGIGTATPSDNLHVVGGIRSYRAGSDSVSSQLYAATADGTRAANFQMTSTGHLALWGYNGSAWARNVTFENTGNVGIGQTSPTAYLHLKAGTTAASTAPIKLTSGSLMTSPEAGAIEFLTDAFYGTITNGPTRRMFLAGTTGRSTAQTAAVASVTTYTLGAADATFEVSANVLVTTSTTHSFTVTCAYTDEGNTARTLTFNFSNVGGTIGTTIANAGGAVPYMGIPMHIRCKASTSITIATTGTFTSVTYNVEGNIIRTA